MLKALRKRHEQNEEGFTLIELMVVVLIIAILMAIAIPTFLGASNSAKDSAVQQNIANSLTDSLAGYTSSQTFGSNTGAALATTAMVTALTAAEPNIAYLAGGAAPTVKNTVYVTVAQKDVATSTTTASDNILLYGISASGKCYYLDAEELGPSGSFVTLQGNWYDSQAGTTCVAAPAYPVTANTIQGSGNSTNIWGSQW
jgi:type IV pilus assembly protein PilA